MEKFKPGEQQLLEETLLKYELALEMLKATYLKQNTILWNMSNLELKVKIAQSKN